MTKRWFLFSLWIMTGCLPQPSSDVQRARPELLIKGRVLPGSESLSGRTAVYVEQDAAPAALSADDGSFALTLDTERLELLRLQHGLQNSRLHLYFVPENTNPESAVIDFVNLEARGELDLGDVQLQPHETVRGRIMAYGAPVAEARVRLGRQELVTAEDGSFSADVPMELSTPLLVEKKGFVQTKGTWLASVQERDVDLYSDLTPVGSIAAEPALRDASNKPISLSFSANGSAYWIRLAARAEALRENYEADAPWLDLRQPLQTLRASVIYYQFADRDKKILGPVLSYTPATREE